MDEEIQQAENIDVPADVTESPTVEVTEAPAEAPAESADEQPQEQPKARNNSQSRIKELLGKTKQLEAQNNEYAEMLQRSSQMQVPDNLSEDQYRALATDASYAAVKVQDLERRLAFKDYSTEVDTVEQKYALINPDSDEYVPEIAEALANTYDKGFIERDANGKFVRQKMSLDEFTKQFIGAFEKAQSKSTAKTSEAIARQAAESVVTPDSTNNSETKAFKDLSIDEMEAKLGVVRL